MGMRYLAASMCLLLLTSCLTEGEKLPLQKMCTLIASVQQYRVDLGANSGLPAFLAVTTGSGTALADECDTNPAFSPVIHRFQDRAYFVEAAPLVNGDHNNVDVNYKPDLKLYGRASCGDPLQLIGQNAAVELTWTPSYPNGADCGTDGFNGAGEL